MGGVEVVIGGGFSPCLLNCCRNSFISVKPIGVHELAQLLKSSQ